jgi:hypothetical protein
LTCVQLEPDVSDHCSRPATIVAATKADGLAVRSHADVCIASRGRTGILRPHDVARMVARWRIVPAKRRLFERLERRFASLAAGGAHWRLKPPGFRNI